MIALTDRVEKRRLTTAAQDGVLPRKNEPAWVTGWKVARRGERGSALLIVFVFSAVLLIMLYREIPVATFEAQRAKEQMTIDRGHEYQRAVQLYYRKFRGQYPANLDQLMNTNGMRFLRRKYKDPLTGKDDWRLLHAGPGGMLTDSKVATNSPLGSMGQNGQSGQGGSGSSSQTGSAASSTSASLFNNSSNSDTSALDTQTTPPVRRSPPAISSDTPPATGAGGDANATGTGQTPTSAQLDADPSKPLLPPTPDPGAASTGTPNASPGANAAGQNLATGTAAGQPNANQAGSTTGANGTQPTALAGAGGVAGVASIAKGRSIKKVNDQDQYSLWEFYYDPSKDNGKGGAGTGANQSNIPGTNQQLQGTQGTQQQQQPGGTSSGTTPTQTPPATGSPTQ